MVVPSIAIREGVYKTFQITEDHFMEYYGKKARFFIYNSKNLPELDNFSSSAGINVMIINIQAFNARGADSRRIREELDDFGSRKPIDVIAANRPILILDEPQKMGGAATQDSLEDFNPLFSLNYSATHKDQHNPVYVLDAVDAFNKRLVKKIEVKGFELKLCLRFGDLGSRVLRIADIGTRIAVLNTELFCFGFGLNQDAYFMLPLRHAVAMNGCRNNVSYCCNTDSFRDLDFNQIAWQVRKELLILLGDSNTLHTAIIECTDLNNLNRRGESDSFQRAALIKTISRQGFFGIIKNDFSQCFTATKVYSTFQCYIRMQRHFC